MIRTFPSQILWTRRTDLAKIILKINNLLVSEGVRYIFCNTFLGHPDIFENFLEHVYQCNFDLPLGTTFLNKVLKLWVENALVLMNISKEF